MCPPTGTIAPLDGTLDPPAALGTWDGTAANGLTG
jgi:hypothetical protein